LILKNAPPAAFRILGRAKTQGKPAGAKLFFAESPFGRTQTGSVEGRQCADVPTDPVMVLLYREIL
jgi:hypothetical protein